MTAVSHTGEDELLTPAAAALQPLGLDRERPGEQHPKPLLTIASSDRCPSCDATLAADQRYCIECGTRRGEPRFKLDDAAATAAGAATGASVVAAALPPRRVSAGITLIVGIAVLLLALGVGVLIGHAGASSGSTKQPVSVVVDGGGTATGGVAGGASATSSGRASGSTRKSKRGQATSSSRTGSGGNSNAILGTSGKVKLAPSTQKVGGSCTSGTAGCQNNKFTGNFWGN